MGVSVSNTYSMGRVSVQNLAGSFVGGLIGASDADLDHNYWDLETSGVSDPAQGCGNQKDCLGVTGLTDAQLKSGLPPGFDPSLGSIPEHQQRLSVSARQPAAMIPRENMKTRLVLFVATLVAFHGSSPALARHSAIVISNDPTQNMNCSAGACSPTDYNAVLNVTDLENLLASSDVTINNKFYGKHVKIVQEIDVIASLNWSTSSKLTLGTDYSAYVQFDSSISVLGEGGLIAPGSASFANDVTVTFASVASVLSLGGHTYTLVVDFPTLASDIAANAKGFFALANDYDAANDQFISAPIETLSGTLLGLGHTISNLSIPKGHKFCEGMVAENEGAIYHLNLSSVSVVLDKKSQYVGGLAGCNRSSLYDVTVSGQITGTSDSDAGGIAGINYSSIRTARSSAMVTGGQAGGIAGQNNSGVSYASASGPVNGVIDSGGLVGNNSQYIDHSFATGSVSGNKNNTGGLAGSNRGQIQNSYAMGSVNGAAGAAGGFVGYNVGSVQYAYSVGATSGGKKYTGGFAGYDANEAIDTAYWDVDTSGISNPADGAGFPKYDPGITGLRTKQLRSSLPLGFSKKDWAEDPNINNGYPYLRANPPQ
ncbi:MAG: hypothetical protein ACJ8IR_01440 [Alphaproteobacteria bacterium]